MRFTKTKNNQAHDLARNLWIYHILSTKVRRNANGGLHLCNCYHLHIQIVKKSMTPK